MPLHKTITDQLKIKNKGMGLQPEVVLTRLEGILKDNTGGDNDGATVNTSIGNQGDFAQASENKKRAFYQLLNPFYKDKDGLLGNAQNQGANQEFDQINLVNLGNPNNISQANSHTIMGELLAVAITGKTGDNTTSIAEQIAIQLGTAADGTVNNAPAQDPQTIKNWIELLDPNITMQRALEILTNTNNNCVDFGTQGNLNANAKLPLNVNQINALDHDPHIQFHRNLVCRNISFLISGNYALADSLSKKVSDGTIDLNEVRSLNSPSISKRQLQILNLKASLQLTGADIEAIILRNVAYALFGRENVTPLVIESLQKWVNNDANAFPWVQPPANTTARDNKDFRLQVLQRLASDPNVPLADFGVFKYTGDRNTQIKQLDVLQLPKITGLEKLLPDQTAMEQLRAQVLQRHLIGDYPTQATTANRNLLHGQINTGKAPQAGRLQKIYEDEIKQLVSGKVSLQQIQYLTGNNAAGNQATFDNLDLTYGSANITDQAKAILSRNTCIELFGHDGYSQKIYEKLADGTITEETLNKLVNPTLTTIDGSRSFFNGTLGLKLDEQQLSHAYCRIAAKQMIEQALLVGTYTLNELTDKLHSVVYALNEPKEIAIRLHLLATLLSPNASVRVKEIACETWGNTQKTGLTFDLNKSTLTQLMYALDQTFFHTSVHTKTAILAGNTWGTHANELTKNTNIRCSSEVTDGLSSFAAVQRTLEKLRLLENGNFFQNATHIILNKDNDFSEAELQQFVARNAARFLFGSEELASELKNWLTNGNVAAQLLKKNQLEALLNPSTPPESRSKILTIVLTGINADHNKCKADTAIKAITTEKDRNKAEAKFLQHLNAKIYSQAFTNSPRFTYDFEKLLNVAVPKLKDQQEKHLQNFHTLFDPSQDLEELTKAIVTLGQSVPKIKTFYDTPAKREEKAQRQLIENISRHVAGDLSLVETFQAWIEHEANQGTPTTDEEKKERYFLLSQLGNEYLTQSELNDILDKIDGATLAGQQNPITTVLTNGAHIPTTANIASRLLARNLSRVLVQANYDHDRLLKNPLTHNLETRLLGNLAQITATEKILAPSNGQTSVRHELYTNIHDQSTPIPGQGTDNDEKNLCRKVSLYKIARALYGNSSQLQNIIRALNQYVPDLIPPNDTKLNRLEQGLQSGYSVKQLKEIYNELGTFRPILKLKPDEIANRARNQKIKNVGRLLFGNESLTNKLLKEATALDANGKPTNKAKELLAHIKILAKGSTNFEATAKALHSIQKAVNPSNLPCLLKVGKNPPEKIRLPDPGPLTVPANADEYELVIRVMAAKIAQLLPGGLATLPHITNYLVRNGAGWTNEVTKGRLQQLQRLANPGTPQDEVLRILTEIHTANNFAAAPNDATAQTLLLNVMALQYFGDDKYALSLKKYVESKTPNQDQAVRDLQAITYGLADESKILKLFNDVNAVKPTLVNPAADPQLQIPNVKKAANNLAAKFDLRYLEKTHQYNAAIHDLFFKHGATLKPQLKKWLRKDPDNRRLFDKLGQSSTPPDQVKKIVEKIRTVGVSNRPTVNETEADKIYNATQSATKLDGLIFPELKSFLLKLPGLKDDISKETIAKINKVLCAYILSDKIIYLQPLNIPSVDNVSHATNNQWKLMLSQFQNDLFTTTKTNLIAKLDTDFDELVTPLDNDHKKGRIKTLVQHVYDPTTGNPKTPPESDQQSNDHPKCPEFFNRIIQSALIYHDLAFKKRQQGAGRDLSIGEIQTLDTDLYNKLTDSTTPATYQDVRDYLNSHPYYFADCYGFSEKDYHELLGQISNNDLFETSEDKYKPAIKQFDKEWTKDFDPYSIKDSQTFLDKKDEEKLFGTSSLEKKELDKIHAKKQNSKTIYGALEKIARKVEATGAVALKEGGKTRLLASKKNVDLANEHLGDLDVLDTVMDKRIEELNQKINELSGKLNDDRMHKYQCFDKTWGRGSRERKLHDVYMKLQTQLKKLEKRLDNYKKLSSRIKSLHTSLSEVKKAYTENGFYEQHKLFEMDTFIYDSTTDIPYKDYIKQRTNENALNEDSIDSHENVSGVQDIDVSERALNVNENKKLLYRVRHTLPVKTENEDEEDNSTKDFSTIIDQSYDRSRLSTLIKNDLPNIETETGLTEQQKKEWKKAIMQNRLNCAVLHLRSKVKDGGLLFYRSKNNGQYNYAKMMPKHPIKVNDDPSGTMFLMMVALLGNSANLIGRTLTTEQIQEKADVFKECIQQVNEQCYGIKDDQSNNGLDQTNQTWEEYLTKSIELRGKNIREANTVVSATQPMARMLIEYKLEKEIVETSHDSYLREVSNTLKERHNLMFRNR